MSLKCNGKTENDCYKCGQYSSSDSLRFRKGQQEQTAEITCGIGGYRIFNKNGERVTKA